MRFDWNEEISSAAVKILQLVSIQEIEQGWKEGGSEAGRRKGGRVGPSNGAEGDEKVCTYREGANSSDLKTMWYYSLKRGTTVRLCLTRKRKEERKENAVY